MGELFRRFEFRALLRRIDELEAAVPGAVIEREEHAVGAARGDAEALDVAAGRRRSRSASPATAPGCSASRAASRRC